jgi:hypothetical protein
VISGTKAWVRCDNAESKEKVTGPGDSNMAREDGEFSGTRFVCTGQRGKEGEDLF